MSETTPNPLNEVVRLQWALMTVLPKEHQPLMAELEAAMNAQHVDFDDLLIRAIQAHLPHRAAEIQGVADHVLRGDPDRSSAAATTDLTTARS